MARKQISLINRRVIDAFRNCSLALVCFVLAAAPIAPAQSAYTWSKSIDDASNGIYGGTRGAFFNLFNHANLSLPNVDFNSAAFGLISETLHVTAGNPRLGEGGPRVGQFALKLIF